MILGPMEIAEGLGIRPVFLPIVLAALFTGIALAAQSIARLFENRNP